MDESQIPEGRARTDSPIQKPDPGPDGAPEHAGTEHAGPDGAPEGTGTEHAGPDGAPEDTGTEVAGGEAAGAGAAAPEAGTTTGEPSRDELLRQVGDLRAEVEVLGRTNDDLLAQREAQMAARRERHRARTTLAVILIILGGILAPLSVVSVWAKNTVTDTNQFVQTVGPLGTNPAIQGAVVDKVTNAIYTQIDVPALVADTLPPRAQVLAGPLGNGIKSFINTTVSRIVTSQQFETIWYAAVRAAQTQVVGALEGTSTAGVKVSNGTVTVDLSQLVNQVKTQLSAQGLTVVNNIPTSKINGTVTLYQSPNVTKIQSGFNALRIMGVWLPIIGIAFLVIGVLLAVRRRRATAWAAFSVFAWMAVFAVGFLAVRHAYLAAVPPDKLPPAAASAAWDITTKFLRQSSRALLVLAAVVWLVAFLSGPARGAGTIRRFFSSGVGRLGDMAERGGLLPTGARAWTSRFRGWLMIADVVLIVAILLLWSHPTGAVVLWMTLLGVFLLLVIEFFAHRTAPAAVIATAPLVVEPPTAHPTEGPAAPPAEEPAAQPAAEEPAAPPAEGEAGEAAAPASEGETGEAGSRQPVSTETGPQPPEPPA